MATAFSKVSVGLPRDPCLLRCERFDDDVGGVDELIELAMETPTFLPVNHDGCFE